MRLRRVLVPAGSLVVALATAPASADDRAIAQQAFQEARDLLAAGKIAEACPKFAAAAQLSGTAGVRLNLSDCYARLGKIASAWTKADEALALAERAGDAAATDMARERMAALKPKLSYLTISVAKARAPMALEITLDGERIPEAVWGSALPVDPGEHEIKASAPGRKPWSTNAVVNGEAARPTVLVPALEEEPIATPVPIPVATATSAAVQAPPETEPTRLAQTSPKAWSTGRTLALASGGLGVVALGVGTVFGVSAKSKKSEYEQHEGADGRCTDQACNDISKDAVSAATMSTVGFVVGGTLVAAGAVLWLTSPSAPASVGTNGREFVVRGHF